MWARLCECTGAEAHDLTFDGRDARLKNCGVVGLWPGAETDGGQGAGEGGWGGAEDICNDISPLLSKNEAFFMKNASFLAQRGADICWFQQ